MQSASCGVPARRPWHESSMAVGPAGIRRCARARMAGRSASRGAARDARGHADGCESNGANGNGTGGDVTGRRRRRRRRGRLRRPVHAPPAARARASRRRCSRPATTSAARGTGTATRAPAATSRPPTTRTRSIPSSRREWTWSEKYATQPEILRYLQHVADKHDLRRDIRFSTRVEAATWDDDAVAVARSRPTAATTITCRYFVMATGCLSMPKAPDIAGADRFARRRVLHQPLAARGRRLHRQAGRRDRHRLVGHPVDPAHRRAGGAS